MRPPSRLPARTGCLSSCSRSGNRGRSRWCCAARGARPSSTLEDRNLRTGRRPATRTRRAVRFVSTACFQEIIMATATHDMNELKRRMQGAIQVLKQELGGLRTGRASANLLEPIQVEAYGTHMPLNQVATVSVPEPRLISVQVWDRSMVHAVEKAI